jgi:tetratricopeptide (TPR) repeat protein
MRKFRPWIVLTLLSLCTAFCLRGITSCAQDKPAPAAAATAPATAPTTPTIATVASPELAARYSALAQDNLRNAKVVIPPYFKESAGLLMAAMRLDPNEPRYPRMLYEAMLQMQDTEGAIKAIKAYRAITVPGRLDDQPINDQLMMVNYIDLNANRMETAEQRLDYYKAIIESQAPDPVKAVAAYRAGSLARERGQSDLEDSLLGQALKFNPLNLDVLRARLDHLSVDGTPAERVTVLQSMLKSNPVQPLVLYRLARELADAGLPEESLRHYTLSANLAGATGISMGREFALGYATELYMMGQAQLLVPCKEILKQLLKQEPGDVEALLLRWLAERAAGDPKDQVEKTAQQVLNAQLNRLLALRQDIVGAANATTRPVESVEPLAIPNLAEDVNKLKDEKFDDDFHVRYAQAVTDLAWYLVFVGGQPAEAQKMLPSLKLMLKDQDKDPNVVRIEGWIYKTQEKFDQAGVKLKAVADQDVLAQAGTLLLWAKNPTEKEPAAAAARKLVTEHPSGLLGALLLDCFKDLNVKLGEREDAAAIKELIAKFPAKEWYRIIDSPKSMYLLGAEMLNGRVLFQFGEPMIARVTIKNISSFDLTIGPEGVIKNDLWFDVQLRGLVQRSIVGVAYERLGQALVLKPGASISQTVRLDQGKLAEAMVHFPNPALTFYAYVRTNPRGEGGSSPGGYGVQFASITERAGFGLNENSLRALTGQMQAGSPSDRLRSLELMGSEIEQIAAQEKSDQGTLLITSFNEILQKTTDDLTQSVGTWGIFQVALHNPARREAAVQRLKSDPDPLRRILALYVASQIYPPEQQKAVASKMLETEKDAMVKMYASGMLELSKLMLALPTTAPSGNGPKPTTAPAPTPDTGVETPKKP